MEEYTLSEEIPQKSPEKIKGNFLMRAANTLVYLVVFLIPVFFLPFTSNFLDFNKQALLLGFVALALILWLASSFMTNKFEVNISFINLPVLILLLVSGAAAIMSKFSYGSFWGLPLPVAPSVLSLLGFAVLYFLIANLFKKDEILLLLLALFVSGFLAGLLGILSLFGKFVLPIDFTKVSSFNTIGTQNALAIFSACLLLIMLPLLFFVKLTTGFRPAI